MGGDGGAFAKGAACSDGQEPVGMRNTVVIGTIAEAEACKQHPLYKSQRNKSAGLRLQLRQKFIFAGDAEETAKGEVKPHSTLAQRAGKLLVKAEMLKKS